MVFRIPTPFSLPLLLLHLIFIPFSASALYFLRVPCCVYFAYMFMRVFVCHACNILFCEKFSGIFWVWVATLGASPAFFSLAWVKCKPNKKETGQTDECK